MRNFVSLSILCLLLTSCFGGGSGGGGTSSSGSSGSVELVSPGAEEDLEKVSRVLKDENLVPSLTSLPVMDRSPSVRLGPRTTMNNEVIQVLFQQLPGTTTPYGALEISEVDTEGQIVESYSLAGETERVLRLFYHNTGKYLYETIYPSTVKIYDPQQDSITTLFSLNTQSNAKRRIARILGRGGAYCGLLTDKKLFRFDITGNLVELAPPAGTLKRWDCHANAMIYFTSLGNLYHWDFQNAPTSFSLSTWGCDINKSRLISRNGIIHLQCLIPNGTNYIKEYYEVHASGLVNVTKLPALASRPAHLDYRFKIDPHSTSNTNLDTNLLVKYKKEPWQSYPLSFTTKPMRVTSVQGSIDSWEFYVKTGLGLTRYNIDTGYSEHTTMPFGWSKLWDDADTYVIHPSAKVYAFPNIFDTNWYQELLTNGWQGINSYLIWAPSSRVQAYGAVVRRDEMVLFLTKQAQLNIISPDTVGHIKKSPFTVDGKFVWRYHNRKIYYISYGTLNNSFTKTLTIYDIDGDSSQSYSLNLPGKFYQMQVISDNKLMFSAGNGFSIWDLTNSQVSFSLAKRFRGVARRLPNNKYLMLIDYRAQLFNPADNSLEELYEFTNKAKFNRYRAFTLADTRMIINDGSAVLKVLQLPFGKLHLE
jgi:hypothetical protein